MDVIKQRMTEELTGVKKLALGPLVVPESVVVTWGIMILLVGLSILLTRRLREEKPGKAQLVLEWFVSFINGFAQESLGEHGKAFAPYLGTIGLYIACANLSGLAGVTPPTKDLNVTAALSLMSMFLIYGSSFYFKGLKGGLHKFVEPMPLLLPINLMEVAIRPLSLCMRLFGNVLGSFVIMELIKILAPLIIPIPFSLYFDVFDGMIQTIVFVFLTTLFVAETIE